MKTIVIVSRKGGAGKTTIAVHLAVAAETHGIATALFDLDPQASAALWSDHRGEPIPAVVPAQAPRLPSLISQARSNEADLVIIDTAPHADGIASDAAAHADAILIPCRPSAFDLDAIGASVRLARAAGKDAFVIINAAPVQGVETTEAIEAISSAGVEVCPVVIHHRKSFASRIHEGRTAQEIEPRGKAAAEIRNLLMWLCEHVISLTNPQIAKVTATDCRVSHDAEAYDVRHRPQPTDASGSFQHQATSGKAETSRRTNPGDDLSAAQGPRGS